MTSGFEKSGTVLTVHLPAELDHHNAEEIRKGADDMMEKQNVRSIVFDFSNTNFMDSSGIAVILKTDRLLRQTGGALALCGVPRQVRRVLDVAGLTNIVPVLEDRAKECEQC